MKKRVMKKLVAALRSGDYEQGRHKLVRVDDQGNESFCCLGVLCDLATQEGVGEWRGLTYSDESGEDNAHVLPTGIMRWAGMKSPQGKLDDHNHHNSLMRLNDRGQTFLEIADHIEANYKEL